MITLTTALFCIYAFLEGNREAGYFHFKYKFTQQVVDEHPLFTAQRSIVAIFAIGFPILIYSYWGLLAIIPIALTFPFVHDGNYYKRRNRLDISVYKDKWRSQTSSSTAKLSIPYNMRLTLFISGVVSSAVADTLLTIFAVKPF